MDDVAIDTSSLNILARRDDLLKKFISIVQSRSFRLVLPSPVTDEVLAGKLPESVLNRALVIRRIWREIGDHKFSISRSSHFIQIEELEHEIGRTPTMSRRVHNLIAEYLDGLAAGHSHLDRVMAACGEIVSENEVSLNVDIAARTNVVDSGLLDTPAKRLSVEDGFRNFAGPEDSFYWFFEALLTDKMMARHLLIPLSKIRAEARYKSLRVGLSLAWLTMLTCSPKFPPF